jgi:hypothetical protein
MKIFGSKKNTSQEEHLLKPDSTSSLESDSLRDDAWDARYFGLILELEEENSSRYESQTLRILKDKSFELSILNSQIKYQLTRTGCTFHIYNSKGFCTETFWTRMGWRRASKIRALPNFFAKSEADAQIDRTI